MKMRYAGNLCDVGKAAYATAYEQDLLRTEYDCDVQVYHFFHVIESCG